MKRYQIHVIARHTFDVDADDVEQAKAVALGLLASTPGMTKVLDVLTKNAGLATGRGYHADVEP